MTKRKLKQKSASTLNGGLDFTNPYKDEKILLEQLGLKIFKNLPSFCEHFIGKVFFDKSYVRITLYAMPSHFWKFEIFDADSGKKTFASTGSGSLNYFWPTVKLIAENMFVIDKVTG